MNQDKEKSVTCSYAALSAELGMPVGTLYAMVSEKKIPHFRIGPRHVIFDRTEIKKWLESHKVDVKKGL